MGGLFAFVFEFTVYIEFMRTEFEMRKNMHTLLCKYMQTAND